MACSSRMSCPRPTAWKRAAPDALAVLLRRAWHARDAETQKRLSVQLVEAVHSVLLMLGEMQEHGGLASARGGEPCEPPFPVPSREHRLASDALAAEIAALEQSHAALGRQSASVRFVLSEKEQQERLLRQEARIAKARRKKMEGRMNMAKQREAAAAKHRA